LLDAASRVAALSSSSTHSWLMNSIPKGNLRYHNNTLTPILTTTLIPEFPRDRLYKHARKLFLNILHKHRRRSRILRRHITTSQERVWNQNNRRHVEVHLMERLHVRLTIRQLIQKHVASAYTHVFLYILMRHLDEHNSPRIFVNSSHPNFSGDSSAFENRNDVAPFVASRCGCLGTGCPWTGLACSRPSGGWTGCCCLRGQWGGRWP
jgi:hypothetical protein